MSVEIVDPPEKLPLLGTVANPAFFSDSSSLLLCYEIAPVDGGGTALIRFGGVIEFRLTSMNTHGLGQHKYPVRPYEFNQVDGADEIREWDILQPRFWVISFNDVTIEVLFGRVELLLESKSKSYPGEALSQFLETYKADG